MNTLSPQPPPLLPARAPRRLLIVIRGLIGDSVMCAPVVEQAKALWPDAKITIAGDPVNCEIFSGCPAVDDTYVIPTSPFDLSKRQEVRNMLGWLKSQRYDTAIILLLDDFAAILAAAGIPIRVGARGCLLEPFLTHTYECATSRTWGPSEKLNSLRALGYDVPDTPPRIWISTAAAEDAASRLSRMGVGAEARIAVIHPFGSREHQWWPPERVPALCGKLAKDLGTTNLLIGGPETRSRPVIDGAANLIDTRGMFSLSELLAVISRAHVVITTDSGPFHIAGGLGRPIVGLFRSSRPEHIKRYPGTRVLLGQHPDCTGRCRWDRCRNEPCRQMKSLDVDEIVDAAKSLTDGTYPA